MPVFKDLTKHKPLLTLWLAHEISWVWITNMLWDNKSKLGPQMLPDLKQISAKTEAIVPRKRIAHSSNVATVSPQPSCEWKMRPL